MVATNLHAELLGPAERDYISPHEFVAKSGLSLATVRRYVRDGRLPSKQPGGRRCRVLIPRSALEQFTALKPVSGPTKPNPSAPTAAMHSNKPLPGPRAKWRSQN
jgi:excisionase family DNA binding protein